MRVESGSTGPKRQDCDPVSGRLSTASFAANNALVPAPSVHDRGMNVGVGAPWVAVGVKVGPPGVIVSVGVGVSAGGSVFVGLAVGAADVFVGLAVGVKVCVGAVVFVGAMVAVGVLVASGLVLVGVGVSWVQTDGAPVQTHPGSTWQPASQPSPLVRLPPP